MNNLMIDIETLGTAHNSLVVSIGAVFFDPKTNELGPELYVVIDVEDASKYLSIDGGTVAWWMKQSEAARKVFAYKNTLALEDALIELASFIKAFCTSKVKVWAKGPSFDCVILRNAYKAVELDVPWAFYNERDVRTVLDQSHLVPKFKVFNPVAHNALEDARFQAKQVCMILHKLAESAEVEHA